MDELAKCPICDSFPVHHTDVSAHSIEGWMYWVGCANTRCLHGPLCTTRERAIAVWNRLSRAARLLAAVEGLAATRHTFTAGEHMGSGLVILQDMGGTIHGEGRGPTLADALIALGEALNG